MPQIWAPGADRPALANCYRCVALEQKIHFLVVITRMIVFLPCPAGITFNDGHTQLLTLQWVAQEVHRVRNRLYVPIIRFRVHHSQTTLTGTVK